MNTSIHNKLAKAIAVVAGTAALAIPAAGAGTSYPDAFQRAVNAHQASYPDAFERAVNARQASYPDAFERAVNRSNSASQVARTLGAPDTRDAARVALQSGPAAQIARHFQHEDALYGAGESGPAAQIARHFQHEDALYGASESGSSQVVQSLGAPDTRDASLLARTQVVRIVESGGFDWADAGIGAGSGIGFLLLIGAGGSLILRQKHRLSNA